MKIPQFNLRTSCLVVGGGPAGYGAALAASEGGCPVLLAERHGFLGGMGAAAGLSCYLNHRDTREDVSDGVYRGLIDALRRLGASYHDDYSQADFFEPEWCKWVMEQQLLAAGAKILYHCLFEAAEKHGDGWRVTFLCKGARIAVECNYLVDTTGDADVCASAGVPVTHGRRSDGKAQPMTMVVQLGGFDPGVWARAGGRMVGGGSYAMEGDCFHAEVAAARAAGKWTIPRNEIAMFWSMPADPTRITINGTRINGLSACNPLDVTAAETEGRRQAQEILYLFKHYIPGGAGVHLLQTGPQVGVRESRRITGRAELTEADVRGGRRPASSVVNCSYPIDVHQPDGAGTQFEKTVADQAYGIAWECLLPSGVDNIVAAGRCISATHEAAGSFRVMPTCMGLGEAAGTAVALAAADRVPLHAVAAERIRAVMDERKAGVLTMAG
ncbi:MAG TPA: FAD-dependent oxidoreductase [Opitutaceae bacterium]